ncbi:ABC transporter ATP-binding protein [Panacagrimonas perspica]|uniref:ATP-binding cassette domain-containing protein n=1 Tax=Panacagrimonas perspica TaxID=381431 RepID=UPI00105B890C|nr:ABC transporter ATP-binding protein [Panacagrimonas perspica]
MTLLTLRALDLRLGTTVLLENVNLVVGRGERVAVLGRNGTGKSTLMRVIEGEAVDAGEVVRAQSLRIARLVQDVPANLTGTVFDVVAEGLGEAGRVLARYQHLVDEHPDNVDEMGRLQARIEALGGWSLDAKVREAISRVEAVETAAFETLSGGLKRRVLLAQALVREPDLMLLDEPTNHLDIDSISWLEGFLKNFPGAILFVTHDRAFLKNLATRIVELDRGSLTDWPGDYENFLRRKEERAHAESQERKLFDKRLAQEEAWIRQGIEARRTRNMGRVDRLMKMRDQFDARRNAPGKANMEIAEAENSGKRVCEAKAISYEIGGQVLVRNFSCSILRGDRVGLIGRNGVGKTTLIRLMLGQLEPTAGEVTLGTNLQIAYFDQLRGGLDENAPVFEALGEGRDFVEVAGQRKHVMGYLQDFLFTPDRARSPVRSLSGGERNRLLLARLFAKPSNLLVLDEPTNDLDLETLELLEELLLDYAGTVLVVSHDRAFLDAVVTRSLVFEGGARIAETVGGYSDYLRQRGAPAPTPKASSGAAIRPTSAAASAVKSAALTGKERRELDELPARIEKLEAEQAALAESISSSALYDQNRAKAIEVQTRLSEMAQSLATAYERWELLEARRSGS